MTYDPSYSGPSRPFPAIQTSPFDNEPAPVTRQRIEHDLDSLTAHFLTRDEQTRDNALRYAVASLPPSWGQHAIILAIAKEYETYIRTGAYPVTIPTLAPPTGTDTPIANGIPGGDPTP